MVLEEWGTKLRMVGGCMVDIDRIAGAQEKSGWVKIGWTDRKKMGGAAHCCVGMHILLLQGLSFSSSAPYARGSM